MKNKKDNNSKEDTTLEKTVEPTIDITPIQTTVVEPILETTIKVPPVKETPKHIDGFQLKDGTVVSDKRFDRLVSFDYLSKNYKISAPDTREPRSFSWDCSIHLDQGDEGACVGFGVTHCLAAQPQAIDGLGFGFAKELYYQAQKNDDWPGGSYLGAHPFYEGTSVISGVKTAKGLRYFDSYHWAFSLQELIIGLGYEGPAVLGIPWFEGMGQTDRKGFIHLSGNQIGGHCILCKGVNIKQRYFILHNSWGTSWGRGGDCYISYDDMSQLLSRQGEVVFCLNKKNS